MTTWQEAKQIMGEVVEFEAIHENITCNFGPCNHIEWRSRTSLDVHGFITSRSENLVHSISIEIYPPTPILRLDRILTQYGPPEKVFLNTVYHGMDDYNLPFGLTLTYPDHQFFIFFLWQAMKSGDNVVGCIQNWYVDLSIEPVSGKWPDEVVLRPLEEVTDLTIDEFYEKFRIVSGGECITTPGEYWP